jgi:hypothetical protein
VLGFPFLFSKKESKMNARTNSPRSNANANDYFNLHVSGLGYLSRVRWVETKSGGRKAQPFLACTIGALRGSSDDVQYTYFDVRVSGQEAIDLVDKLGHDVDENRKVIVAFKASDIYVNVYEREMKDKSGRKTGQVEAAANIKGRLLQINMAKVDGVEVYRRAAASETDQDDGGQPEQQDEGIGTGSQDNEFAPVPEVPARPHQAQQFQAQRRGYAPGQGSVRPSREMTASY